MTRLRLRSLALPLLVSLLSACSSSDDDATLLDDPVDVCANPGDTPTATFTATRPFINEGETTVLRWDSPDADRVSIAPEIGIVERNGELSVSPDIDTEYRLEARLGDTCNVLTQTITVRELAAVAIQANTVEGNAPLTVRFTPVVDSRTAINRYYWDFEGDGGPVDGGLGVEANGFDNLSLPVGQREFDVVGRDVNHTFNTPGTYTARVRVWDLNDNQAEATLDIVVGNSAPNAIVSATPTTGTVPMLVTLEVTEATDNEGVDTIEWDFEGDGVFDETTTIDSGFNTQASERIEHLYERIGNFRPVIRVTDTLGQAAEFNPLNLQVNAVLEDVPGVSITPRPTEGFAPLAVTFQSTLSSSDLRESQIAWDFDGDGTVDNTTDTRPTHIYERIGTYYPTLTLTTADGVVGRDISSVTVEANHQLLITNSTIDPESDEEAMIDVAINGSSDVQIVVESAAGATVRTLRDWQDTETGNYPFQWDGRDDAGDIASPGDYYAVVRYRTGPNAEERTLDLRTSTGGLIFYPSDGSAGGFCAGLSQGCGVLTISGIRQIGSQRAIEPYNDPPVTFDFTMPYNARVTAYVTVRGRENFSPATFFRGRVMAAGDYSIRWFGDGTDGKILPPRRTNTGYVPAIFGLTASDNAIFLSHETTLKEFRVEPYIFFPSPSDEAESVLTFDLNRRADILMRVDSVDAGTEVFRTVFPDVQPGSGVTLRWDGQVSEGAYAAPGGYRIELTAQDEFGESSLPVRALQRIRY